MRLSSWYFIIELILSLPSEEDFYSYFAVISLIRKSFLSIISIQHSRYGGSARHVATPGDGTVLSEGSYNRLAMNGKEVYKFATREVPKVIKEALDAADMDVEQVDWLLLHQV